jgi:phospholipase C
MLRRRLVLSLLAVVALAVIPAGGAAASSAGPNRLSRINPIVVIYQENHSFDNLYGMWEGVNGLRDASRARTTQVNQAGDPYECLLQNDVNLTSPPLSATCTDTTTGTTFTSHFTNQPFTIDDYIPPRPPPARRRACSPPTGS